MKPHFAKFLARLPLVLSAGCAQSPHPPTSPPDYLADARRCDRQSQSTTKIPINLGGLGSKYNNVNVGGSAADIIVPMGADRTEYRVCMEGLGWKTDPAKDTYLARVETCRQSAKAPSATDAPDKKRIGSKLDPALYEECIRNNGLKGRVVVLPLEPAGTGQATP